MKLRYINCFMIVLFLLVMLQCGVNKMETELTQFIDSHVEKIAPLIKQMNLSYWDAAISGQKEDFEKVACDELKVRTVYSDTTDFIKLKKFKESGEITDPLLLRQMILLYNNFLQNQIETDLLKKIVNKSSEIENEFTVFRGTIKGRKVTDNNIKDILKKETDSRKRRDAWYASKQVGEEVASDIIELVKLRNEAAEKLGFDNFYVMSLSLAEQTVEDLNKIFDELAALTDQPFKQLKAEMDEILADKYGVAVEGLMPWHYHDPFFQEAPSIYEVDLDKYYQDQDVKFLAQSFFDNIGLNVDDIIERSDLYEKEGKNQHAFCTHIDRAGDVRVLCNLKNDEKWMGTMLHELGHAVYDKNLDLTMPYLLRDPAHIFTTEAIAMLFGRLSMNASWIQQMTHISEQEKEQIADTVTKSLRLQMIVFSRWCQVMVRFEQQLYANPDQDLNALWWDLVEKYQLVKKPVKRNSPDWAAKIHFIIAPVYYHNYMLGELLASQLHSYIVKNVLQRENDNNVSYVNQKMIGDYLKQNVFQVGAKYQWNDMIEKATLEPLTAKYFVQQFIEN